jgi:colicin import membrane protein
MSNPLQQFFLDLKTFAEDLRDLFNGRQLRTGLAGSWQDLWRDRQLQLPLIFTVAVHLGALLLSLAGPLFLSGKVRIPEVYQVELFNAAELPPEPAPAKSAPAVAPKPVPKPVPPPVKEQAKPAPPPISVAEPKPAPIAKPKAVSLSPIKQRLLKEEAERKARDRQTRLLDLRMEEFKLDRQQKEAEEAAREAARKAEDATREAKEAKRAIASQAVGKVADLYRTTTPATGSPATNVEQTSGPAGGSDENSPRQLEALDRYKARIFQHIKPNWQLPDLQNWDETLSAKIVLKMKWDGSVDSTWFEKKSGDYRFDQYVKKAVENSVPLPPLPMEFDRKSEEIAVTFTPGGLR